SIPLFEISIKGTTIPVTLDYNAGGIRVNEAATWVGLGWSLSYGGQISRSVKGKPDEYTFITKHRGAYPGSTIAYFRTLPDIIADWRSADRSVYMQKAKDPTQLENDLRPDEFYYSLAGYSGRYMFDQKNDSFVMFPKSDVKVDVNFSSQSAFSGRVSFSPVDFWSIITPDGISAEYGRGMITRRGLGDYYDPYTIDSWNIKKIINTFNDSITYHYSSGFDTTRSWSNNSYYSSVTKNYIGQAALSYAMEKHLERIDFPNGSIHFIAEPKTDKGVRLKEVIVKDLNNTVIKRILLNHSYFHGTFGNNKMGPVGDEYDYRLRLDSLSFAGNNNIVQTYKFDYYFDEFDKKPSRNCLGMDSWGYFNGADNNYLPPLWRFEDLGQTTWGFRHVGPEYAHIFNMKSITYPTGGKEVYEYECNTALIEGPEGMLPVVGKQETALNTASITISGSNRLAFGITPDSIAGTSNKEYYFRKSFVIPAGGAWMPYSSGWNCSTNFFTGSGEDWNSCYTDNITFLLEKMEDNGTRTELRRHVARNCSSFTYYPEDHKPIMMMAPGNYRMTVILQYRGINPSRSHYTGFNLYWRNNAPVDLGNFMYVGGQRIKTITTYSSENLVATKRQFNYLNPETNNTSGKLISIPLFFQYGNAPGNSVIGQVVHSRKVLANSMEPLQTTGGAYLGYEYVTDELIGPSDTIKTRYKYVSVMPLRGSYVEYNNTKYGNNPYNNTMWGLIEAQEWKRGKLKEVVYLKQNEPVRKEIYSYYGAEIVYTPSTEESVEDINTDLISAEIAKPYWDAEPGFDFHDLYQSPTSLQTEFRYRYAHVQVNIPSQVWGILPSNMQYVSPYTAYVPDFKRYTGIDKIQSKKTYDYTPAGSILTEELYYYDKYPQTLQLTRKDRIDSKGDTLRDHMYYSTEYTASGSPYISMVQKNMINLPVKTINTRNTQILKTQELKYKSWGASIIAPELSTTQNGTGLPYTTTEVFAYDEKGNILSMAAADKLKKSFIWAHQLQYPIAVVLNAKNTEIAYTSFDAPETGNWTYTDTARYRADAITGRMAYTLVTGKDITKSALPSGKKYIVS
ncbi:MAG: hypothetical protein ACTHMC_09340, partial [Pseudobacter sp.]|uniref:hypothetical protein n=1 Tax=Pseudobacter sp. TaxID=2045420 RepID=UPI003F7EF8AF